MPAWASAPAARQLAGILLSALLAALYARGAQAWPLGFVMLVPCLYCLNTTRTLPATLGWAYLMSLAWTFAVFGWFGAALGRYTQLGAGTGLACLLLGAPLFQPQILVFALVRQLAGRRFGPLLRALAGAAAWVAAEWLLPKLLGDTLGYGLYPSRLMRQGAALGGGAGLTVLLLLTNEGLATAFSYRQGGWRAMRWPLALSALPALLLAGYGQLVLSSGSVRAGPTLRLAMVQANLVDYEGLRQQKGAHAVVRSVLDRHFAMSYDAVVGQRAAAVLWSETAYPTTFGQPKSAAGAAFDREILEQVTAAGVPFVFGTYDRDMAGEYNAAAFVQPGTGLTGLYRKTRLFPLTEYVPSWLDGPRLRRWLPWTGNWRAGNGARVFPLQLADGREIPVLPLICLDDVDTSLALDGARLGAQAILTMSNDAWFSTDTEGARLHQSVAAFRSIETGLPQFRVTTNGYSAAIDASGEVLAGTAMGAAALLVADQRVGPVPATLMVRWGDWVGPAACSLLMVLTVVALMPRQSAARARSPALPAPGVSFPLRIIMLPPAARLMTAALRGLAMLGLLGLGVMLMLNPALRANTLAQIRLFAGCCLAPELAAWCVLQGFAGQATLRDGVLELRGAGRRIELALGEIASVAFWRVALPAQGLELRTISGQALRCGLVLAEPLGFAAALAEAGAPPAHLAGFPVWAVYGRARLALRRRCGDRPVFKFGLLPLALAIPAFQLHQQIAYGSGFGEYYSFGVKAYLLAFGLWWAAWLIGVTLWAGLLRGLIEAGTLLAAVLSPAQTIAVRHWLECAGQLALYLGLPLSVLANLVLS